MGATETRLGEELERLLQERERLMSSVDDTADDPADSADQAQVVELRAEAERIDARIEEVRAAMEQEDQAAPTDGTVGEGTQVKLRFDDGEPQTVRVGGVPVPDEDPPVITAKSPLGEAIIGHKKGETVTYEGPKKEQRVTIESIKPST